MSSFLNQVMVPGIVGGCVYSLVATVFNVAEKTTRILSFAHGSIIMWAAMAALVASSLWGWPAAAALALGVVAALVFGVITERLVVKPFLDTNSALAWILGTLGASLIFDRLAFIPFDGQGQAFPIGLSRRAIDFGIIEISPAGLFTIGCTALTFAAVAALYRYTRIGQMLLAVADDFEGARMLGISPSRMSLIAAVVSALIAALTGFLAAPTFLVSPALGTQLLFVGFVGAAIGGLGSLPGGMVGGLVTGMTIQVTAVYIGSVWINAALFVVLGILLLIRPWGLFGTAPVRRV